MAPTTAPTPMPALAPELRPDEAVVVELRLEEGEAGGSVMEALGEVVGIV